MNTLRRYTKLLQSLALWVSVAMYLTVFLPASAAAACPPGQWTTSAGACCPSDQVQITSQGDVNCTSQTPACSNVTNANALSCFLSKYVNPAIALLSAAVGVVVVISIIRGAITYTTSAGDPSKAAAGKQHIVNALIGLAAYVMLYAFLQFLIPGGLLN